MRVLWNDIKAWIVKHRNWWLIIGFVCTYIGEFGYNYGKATGCWDLPSLYYYGEIAGWMGMSATLYLYVTGRAAKVMAGTIFILSIYALLKEIAGHGKDYTTADFFVLLLSLLLTCLKNRKKR